MDIAGNIEDVRTRIARACDAVGRSPGEITVVAVTKTVEPDLIVRAFEAGIKHFGENRVQDASRKIPEVAPLLKPAPPTWHMIGHLQTNKAKAAVELFAL